MYRPDPNKKITFRRIFSQSDVIESNPLESPETPLAQKGTFEHTMLPVTPVCRHKGLRLKDCRSTGSNLTVGAQRFLRLRGAGKLVDLVSLGCTNFVSYPFELRVVSWS